MKNYAIILAFLAALSTAAPAPPNSSNNNFNQGPGYQSIPETPYQNGPGNSYHQQGPPNGGDHQPNFSNNQQGGGHESQGPVQQYPDNQSYPPDMGGDMLIQARADQNQLAVLKGLHDELKPLVTRDQMDVLKGLHDELKPLVQGRDLEQLERRKGGAGGILGGLFSALDGFLGGSGGDQKRDLDARDKMDVLKGLHDELKPLVQGRDLSEIDARAGGILGSLFQGLTSIFGKRDLDARDSMDVLKSLHDELKPLMDKPQRRDVDEDDGAGTDEEDGDIERRNVLKDIFDGISQIFPFKRDIDARDDQMAVLKGLHDELKPLVQG